MTSISQLQTKYNFGYDGISAALLKIYYLIKYPLINNMYSSR